MPKFRIVPLEERILLDAAAVAQVVAVAESQHVQAQAEARTEANQDHSADKQQTTAQQDPQAKSTTKEAGKASKDDSAVGSTPDTSHAMEDTSPSAPGEAVPLRVLVLSSDIHDAQALKDAASNNVKVVYYNSNTTSLNQLIEQISTTLEGKQAQSIAFASYGKEGSFTLANNVTVNLSHLQSDPTLRAFWGDVGKMVKDGGSIELLACKVAGSDEGMKLVSSIDTLADSDGKQIGVNASIDTTGQEASGGDWLLEVGGVHADKVYFEAKSLGQWSGILDIAPFQVEEINPAGNQGSDPDNFIESDGALFFTAKNSSNGTELWKSDGTQAGTTMIKDIYTGGSSSSPNFLTSINGTVYFSANDGVNGNELWRSDGTAEGTYIVKNITAGSSSTTFSDFTVVNNTLFFVANNGSNGAELWKSDGTATGTVLVKDINTVGEASTSSSPTSLVNFGGVLYFSANDGINGRELWKSDGTAAGTVLVSNIGSGASSSNPSNFTVVGNTLFFTAKDNSSIGTELWKTNGTTSGTVLVKNIASDLSADSNPSDLTAVGNTLFFTAQDTNKNGIELWKSDGTAAGTVMVKNIDADCGDSSNPAYLTAIGNTLYFSARDSSSNGVELWKSDGTSSGTVMVKNIASGSASSNPINLTNVNGLLIFAATTATHGTELWQSDGTSSGTTLVADLNLGGNQGSSPSKFTVVGDQVFFSASNQANNFELWALYPVNTPPVNSIPGMQTVSEDTGLVFSSSNSNLISISDVNGSSSIEKMTLTVSNGVLSLASTSGLTILSGSNGSNTITVSGTVANLNNALNGLTYTPTSNFNGNASLTITTQDSSNTHLSDTDTVAIFVSPVNDAPTNSVPSATQVVAEDGALVFTIANSNQIQIKDVDAASGVVQVSLSAANGTLSLASPSTIAALTFTTGDGVNDSSMVFKGTLSQVNAALATMTFNPVANFNGSTTLTITTSDLGNMGSGSTLSDTDVVNINVTAVNDAPVNNVPPSQTVLEDGTLTFSSQNSNQITVSDVDGANAVEKVTLSVSNGTLTLASLSGLTINSGANGTNTLTFTGTISSINNALNGLIYTPTNNYNGSDTLIVASQDAANSSLSDTKTVSIGVTSINDAPLNNVPAVQITVEDTAKVFSSTNGNQISISDVDGPISVEKVTLSVTNGTITLGSTSGLIINAGANGSNTLTFTGTVVDINNALNGLTYTPTANFNGLAVLTIITQDSAHANLSDTDTVVITVTSVNDAPLNTVPSSQTVLEDSTLIFSSENSNQITVSDADGASSVEKVTLSVSNGTLNLASTLGLTINSGANGTNTLTFTGTLSSINNALNGLVYTPSSNYNGNDTLTVTSQDSTDSSLIDTKAIAISVNPINDAPLNNVPNGQTTSEDTVKIFSSVNGNQIFISDVDGLNSVEKVTLTVTNGTLTLGSTSGLTINAGANGSNTLTFTGTVVDINNALNGLSYTPTANFNGSSVLTITTQDFVNTSLSDVDTVTINVSAVNDAPINSVPAVQTMAEDTTKVFSSSNRNQISISDVDGPNSIEKVTLSVTNGTVKLGSTSGLTINSGANNSTTITFTGTVSDINNALNFLRYTPTTNFNGTALLTLTTQDSLNANLSDTDTVAINVTAVNDAPSNNVPGTQTTAEDTAKVFSSSNGNQISISDFDGPNSIEKVTLSVTNGTLRLSSTSGLTINSGSNGSNTITFTGTVTNINNALNGLIYTPTANFTGSSVLKITTQDATNSCSSDVDTVVINVTAVNDAPVNRVPAATQTVLEDSILQFTTGNNNQITVSDVDGVRSIEKVTLNVSNGVLTLASTSGLTINSGANGTSTISFTGTISAINNALNGLVYTPTANYNGNDILTITSQDSKNSSLSDTKTIVIAVTPINDAPVNTVPAGQIMAEDTTKIFSSSSGNQISISDVDGPSSIEKVTLSATNGILTLGSTNGLIINSGANGSTSVTFTGTVAAINTALNGLTYTPTANFSGTSVLTITTQDSVNASLSDTDTVIINVTAVNDAPVNVVPTVTQTVTEDGTLVFNASHDNQIQVSDVDAASGIVQVTLSTTNGTFSLASPSAIAALTFTTGDGVNDSSMVFKGTLTQVNSALSTVTFTPTANFNGSTTLTVTTSDLGHAGSGSVLSDTDIINITVTAVNDAPFNTVPHGQLTAEDTSKVFSSSNGNQISIADVDGLNSIEKVTLTVSNGTLTLASTSGLTINSGANGSNSVTFTGSVADINTALNGLIYTPTANFNGSSVLTITTQDPVNASLSATDTVAINVTPVNDAPVNNIPTDQTTAEDTVKVFSFANGNQISISDVDGSNSIEKVTLSVTNGTLTLGSTSGLIIHSGGNNSNTVTFTGTVADINKALNGLIYTPTANFTGSSVLTITTQDSVNPSLADTDTVAINVTPANDAPIHSVPAGQITAEDTTKVFSFVNGNQIKVFDVDGENSIEKVTLSITNGTLRLASTSGLTINSGANGSSTLTFTGTVSNINTALNGLIYTPTSDFNGSSILTITTQDYANASLSATDTVAINVTPVNDAPINIAPITTQTVVEDGTLVFNTANSNQIQIVDVDAASGLMQVTLNATHGTFSLASPSSIAALAFTTGDGMNDSSMVFKGTLAQINAALATVTFNPTPNFNGNATLTLITSDLGNTGTEGALADRDVININVTAVNDAPITSVPEGQTISEDTTLTFSSGNSNQITVSDIDGANSIEKVTLSVSKGTLNLASTAGLTIDSGANGSNTLTFTGTLSAINNALNGLIYIPAANYNGTDTLTITSQDSANSNLSDTKTVMIGITPVNDTPVNSVPNGQLTAEDTAKIFSEANGNKISISDVDGLNSIEKVTLSVTNGTLILASTSGLTINSGANSSSTITFTGTVASINMALNGLTYKSATNYNGIDTLIITTQDTINASLSDTATVAINVIAVNDAPLNTVPNSQIVLEDSTLTFSSENGNQITVSDVDGAGSIEKVTLSVSRGVLNLANLSGLTINSGANGTNTITFTGTLSAINNALNGLTYTPTENFNGSSILTITTQDALNASLSNTDTVLITVDAVNDAPVNTVPGTQTIAEDMSLVFSGSNAISISDVDSGEATVTLTVGHGTLSLSSSSGLTFLTGDGTNDATMTFSGSLNDINVALLNLSYKGNLNFNGSDQLTLVTQDRGNTGSGGEKITTSTVAIVVDAVNDAPVTTVPGMQKIAEDMSLVFSGSNTISISDVDSGFATVTLTVRNGTLNLASTSGINFINGDGINDSTMTFSGSLSAINAALANLSYTSDLNFNGSDQLTVVTQDQGNTGSGGAQTTISSVEIIVEAVNDAPVNRVPNAQITTEDTTLIFSGSNAISISDVDSGTAKVTLTVGQGTLSLSSTSGLLFLTGDGTDEATMTFLGSVQDINVALANLSYRGNVNFNGLDQLTMITQDQGNTGSGGEQMTTSSVAITVEAVNDAPVNTFPGAQTIHEDAVLVFSGSNTISISDVDSGSAIVTLSVSQGTLDLGSRSGLTFSVGDGLNDTTMTFSGSVQDINVALANLSYRGNVNFNGLDQLTIVTQDLGNAGSGGEKTSTSTVAIAVEAVNDAPINTVPASQTVNEDTTLIFSGSNAFSIGDVDADFATVILTVGHGTLSLSGLSGLTFLTGDGINDSTMTFSGSIHAINDALANLSYKGNVNFNGLDQLTMITQDQGNTGIGGEKTTVSSVAITVEAVNDAPVNTVPGPQTVNEDTALVFSGSNTISISDVDSGVATVTLSVGQGTLSLSGTSGLTFLSGDGINDASMTFSGSVNAINAALANLSYKGNINFNGLDQLTIVTQDQGNTGSGGEQTATSSILITVEAVNDAPVNTVPGPQTVNEDTALVFSGSNTISISDVDSGVATVTLSVGQGTLSLSGTSGLTFLSGDGINDASMTFSGSVNAINAALANLSYKGNVNFNGLDQLTIVTQDQGNTGSSGEQIATSSILITVEAVNDAPTNIVPGPQTVNEDTALVFSGSNTISISDVDSGVATVTLSVGHGTLNLASISGLTFITGDGVNDSIMTFSGSISAVNAALANLSYTAYSNFNGVDQLTVITRDQGNMGVGGEQVATNSVLITVEAVDDAPAVTYPNTISTLEDSVFTFDALNSIQVSDIDGTTVQMTLSVANGTLTLGSLNGLILSGGSDGINDRIITMRGSIIDINAALVGLVYTPDPDFNGPDTLNFSVTDEGGNSRFQAIAVDVQPVNDVPYIYTQTTSWTASENGTLIISSANGNGISIGDKDGSEVQVTLFSTSGTFSLFSTAGLTFINGDGINDNVMVMRGSIADINAAMNGMAWMPAPNFAGQAQFQIAVNDLGVTGGVGGPQQTVETLQVTVNALPINTPIDGTGPMRNNGSTINTPDGFIYTPITIDQADSFQIKRDDRLIPVHIFYSDLTSNTQSLSLEGAFSQMIKAPQVGKVTLYEYGAFQYQSSEVQIDEFTYQFKDIKGEIRQVTVVIGGKTIENQLAEDSDLAKAMMLMKSLGEGVATYATAGLVPTISKFSQIVVKHEEAEQPPSTINYVDSPAAQLSLMTVAALAISLDPDEITDLSTSEDQTKKAGGTSRESIVLDALRDSSKPKKTKEGL